MSKLTLALALSAIHAHGVRCGQLIEADATVIKALAAEGSVDPHKDAVAAAKAAGVETVRVESEPEKAEGKAE